MCVCVCVRHLGGNDHTTSRCLVSTDYIIIYTGAETQLNTSSRYTLCWVVYLTRSSVIDIGIQDA